MTRIVQQWAEEQTTRLLEAFYGTVEGAALITLLSLLVDGNVDGKAEVVRAVTRWRSPGAAPEESVVQLSLVVARSESAIDHYLDSPEFGARDAVKNAWRKGIV